MKIETIHQWRREEKKRHKRTMKALDNMEKLLKLTDRTKRKSSIKKP